VANNYRQGSLGRSLSVCDRGERHRRFVLGSVVIAILVGLLMPSLSLQSQFWLIAIPVGLFGLSHGGADPWIMRQIFGQHRRNAVYSFAAYLAVMAVFVGLIWLSPLLALFIFLAISVWHFGYTDAAYLCEQNSKLVILLSGSSVIVGPILGYPAQTGQLFSWLLGTDAETCVKALGMIGPPLGLLWLVGFVRLWKIRRQDIDRSVFVELSLVAAAMVLLPPLIAFGVYFCLIHSARHFIALARVKSISGNLKDQLRSFFPLLWPATLGALALGFVVWSALAFWNPKPETFVDVFRVLFWGLAALTLPHSFMIDRWWKGPDPIH